MNLGGEVDLEDYISLLYKISGVEVNFLFNFTERVYVSLLKGFVLKLRHLRLFDLMVYTKI